MCFVGDQYQSDEMQELSNHTALCPALVSHQQGASYLTARWRDAGMQFDDGLRLLQIQSSKGTINSSADKNVALYVHPSVVFPMYRLVLTRIFTWDTWSWNARILDLSLLKEDIQWYTVKCSDFDVLVWSICRVSHSFFFLSRVSGSQEAKCVLDREYLSAPENGAARRRESERFH